MNNEEKMIRSWIRSRYIDCDTKKFYLQILAREMQKKYFKESVDISPEMKAVYMNGLIIASIEIDELEKLLKSKNKKGK